MNLVGISAGAVITSELGKAFDGWYKDLVFIIMIASVVIAIALQLKVLNPVTEDMTEELMEMAQNKKKQRIK